MCRNHFLFVSWADMKLMERLRGRIIAFFVPSREERVGIQLLTPEVSVTRLPGPFDYGIGLGDYSPATFHDRTDMGALVQLMKCHHSRPAADKLAAFLIGYLTSHPLPNRPDLIVTIPDSITNRPFSPVGYIADTVAEHFGWSCRHDMIVRTRLEKPQKDRSYKERLEDRRPRYALQYSDILAGRHILFFDDIYATGRSLIEAADLIRAGRPASIMALTLVKLRPI